MIGNPYNNPFMNETGFFKTDRGNSMRIAIYWAGATVFCERAQWIGDKMSFYDINPGLFGYRQRHATIDKTNPDGFVYGNPVTSDWEKENFERELPQSLEPGFGRHHAGAQVFLTHEFISALLEDRPPAIDIYESLAMNVPGIIAHQSALRGGVQLDIPQFDR
jgi:hypothetical protein